jgi:hypothetical protein
MKWQNFAIVNMRLGNEEEELVNLKGGVGKLKRNGDLVL